MSSIVVNPSKLEPTKLTFRTSMGCTASLMPERFRDKLERWPPAHGWATASAIVQAACSTGG